MATTKKPKKTAKKPAKKTAPAKKAAPVKKTAPPEKVESATKVAAPAAGGYVYTVGRRKRAVAQVRFWDSGKGEIKVNGRDYLRYFPVFELHDALLTPLRAVGKDGKITIEIKTVGGGLRGQAEAARLGIARALIALDPDFRKSLKKLGLLKRDARKKERKKPGLKKARRAPQWKKR